MCLYLSHAIFKNLSSDMIEQQADIIYKYEDDYLSVKW